MSDEEGALAGASEDECTVESADPIGAGVPETWSPFEAEYDGVELPVVPKVMGSDGLPHLNAPENRSDIPELSEATLICMAICSKFVVRNKWGDILAEFTAEEVNRAPNGKYRVPWELARKRLDDVKEHVRGDYYSRWYEVEPIRPQCNHYIRQKSQFELNPEAKDFYRLCALRRSTEGAMMSLKDRGMWACSARDPRDEKTEATLDDFDKLKKEQGSKRTFLPIFNLTEGGIFGGTNGGQSNG